MKNLILLIPLLGLMVSCVEDWGQKDPIPSTAKYPTVTNVGSYTFGEDLFGTDLSTVYTVTSYSSESICEVVEDDEAEYALHIKNAAITLDNDLKGKDCQTGAGVTFWIKQTVEEQDAQIISFESQTKASSEGLQFTADGVLTYNGTAFGEGAFVLDPVGEWHYVALTVKTNGYTVHVDGDLAVEYENDDEADIFAEIIEYITTADVVVVLDDAEETYLSQLKLYTNEISSKQTNMSSITGSSYSKIGFFLVCEESWLDIRSVGFMPFIKTGNKTMQIGEDDNSGGWWSDHSDVIALYDGETLHWKVTNHNDLGANNMAIWNNWALVCTKDPDHKATDAAYNSANESFVIRLDGGWWGTASATSSVDFPDVTSASSFLPLVDGAVCDITVARSGSSIKVTSVITTTSGATYHLTFDATDDYDEDSAVGIFLSLEYAHITWEPYDVVIGDVYNGTYTVGDESFGNVWWTTFSDLSVITDTHYPWGYTLYNHSLAAANYQFWVLVCSNALFTGDEGYAEYFVLRSDSFGWGPEGDSRYDASNITSSFNWDTYTTDMQGAFSIIYMERGDDDDVTVTSEALTTAGSWMPTYSFYYQGLN